MFDPAEPRNARGEWSLMGRVEAAWDRFGKSVESRTGKRDVHSPNELANQYLAESGHVTFTAGGKGILARQHADELVAQHAQNGVHLKTESVRVFGEKQLRVYDPARQSPTTERHPGETMDFTAEQRRALAKTGEAMPDGSYPIRNTRDLANAVLSLGRATDPAAVKAHIIKRARALDAINLLPAAWGIKK